MKVKEVSFYRFLIIQTQRERRVNRELAHLSSILSGIDDRVSSSEYWYQTSLILFFR